MTITALATGTLVKVGELKTSPKGKDYIYFSISMKGETNYFISCVAFGDDADKIAGMTKNSAISAKGELKPSDWVDKDGAKQHGLKLSATEVICI